MSQITIRTERPSEAAAIERVNVAAFPSPAEATLVRRLRETGTLTISLVAETEQHEIVGHIAFSPVSVEGVTSVPPALGLAPVAVSPECQRQGIGAQLIRAGLQQCATLASPFVVVLGEPHFYQRFGFTTASAAGLMNEYGVDAEFMVLGVGTSTPPRGMVRYAPVFAEL